MMRKITPAQITVFVALFSVITALATLSTMVLVRHSVFGEFYSVACLLAFGTLFYLWAFIVYRLSHRFMPLVDGDLAVGSREEFAYQVDSLFRLVLFYPLIRTYFIPTPLMRLVYQALGAKMGDNTYSGGAILDPALTRLGANTIIGHDAVVFSHVIEGADMALATVHIGNSVTVGAKAVIMPGVVIEDGAVVSVGAVVLKGTCIPAGEFWGGTPARPLAQPGQRRDAD